VFIQTLKMSLKIHQKTPSEEKCLKSVRVGKGNTRILWTCALPSPHKIFAEAFTLLFYKMYVRSFAVPYGSCELCGPPGAARHWTWHFLEKHYRVFRKTPHKVLHMISLEPFAIKWRFLQRQRHIQHKLLAVQNLCIWMD